MLPQDGEITAAAISQLWGGLQNPQGWEIAAPVISELQGGSKAGRLQQLYLPATRVLGAPSYGSLPLAGVAVCCMSDIAGGTIMIGSDT